MIAWFASVQNSDGSIPASPFRGRSTVLIDYNAYWIEALHDYTLHTGDLALLRQVWPSLVKLVDELYPALAGWFGDAGRANRWTTRAGQTAAAFAGAFWDSDAGAFRDTTADTDVHPLDGNAFALLAGLATPSQAQSALAYIDRTMSLSYGNAIADTDGWRGLNWGDGDNRRVYPFISYFEVLARFSLGADSSALELIRREWGFMATRNPGTMWETIGSETGGPADMTTPSWSHGWSSGAAPALTTYVLGVRPVTPGFATFTVTPHPGDLDSARGTVPTPHGPIRVSWQTAGGKLVLQVEAPRGTVWENDPTRPAVAQPATKPEVVSLAVRRAAVERVMKPLRAAWLAAGGW